MKKLSELKLNELIELKSAVDLLVDKYAKELTTYAEINKDMSFTKMSLTEKTNYDNFNKNKKLSSKIQNKIEEIISFYYEND